MTPALLCPNIEDAFDMFVGTAVLRAEDLYHLDGETAFRRRGGSIETFDDLTLTGGRP